MSDKPGIKDAQATKPPPASPPPANPPPPNGAAQDDSQKQRKRVLVSNPEVGALATITEALGPLSLKQQSRILSFLSSQVNEQLDQKHGSGSEAAPT